MPFMAMTLPVLIYRAHVSPLTRPFSSLKLTKRLPDRLPTVSASAALDELASDAGVHIPTGLAELDKALAVNSPLQQVVGNDPPGGITRGQVTELWGPPGAGKTAFG